MKDVLVSLTEDHLLLSELARSVRTMSDRLSRSDLFDSLAKALGGHFAAVEHVILPAFSRSGSHRLDSGVLIAHMNVKRHLAELLMRERNNAAFEADLLAFCDEVEEQADREQLELLPALRVGFDEAERAYLASEVEAEMMSRLGDHAFLRAPQRREPRHVSEMVEEAEVVLSSLKPGPPVS